MQRQLIVAAVVFIIALIGARVILPYAAPFIIALIAVVILDPIITRLEMHGVNRAAASFALVFASLRELSAFSLLLTACEKK